MHDRREDKIDVEVEASGFVKQQLGDEEEGEEEEEDQEGDEAVEESIDEQPSPSSTEVDEFLSICPPQDEVETALSAVEKQQKMLDEQDLMSAVELEDQLTELHLTTAAAMMEGSAATGEEEEPQVDWDALMKPASSRRTAGSYATSTASTIHPEVIKERVKKTMARREVVQSLTRIRAKGEASAATRKKRENKDLIRSDGIWGWDNWSIIAPASLTFCIQNHVINKRLLLSLSRLFIY